MLMRALRHVPISILSISFEIVKTLMHAVQYPDAWILNRHLLFPEPPKKIHFEGIGGEKQNTHFSD